MIGIFGGTGFYEFVSGGNQTSVATPWGPPSAPPVIGTVEGIDVAFIPRHGDQHQFPPHRVNFRANLWAMREVGVDRIVGPTAVGSLQVGYAPGSLAVPDQIVDWTRGRKATFFDGPLTHHISFADPYCPELRPPTIEAMRATGVTVHDGGAVVVIEGPRFSTRAESAFFSNQGWQLINMTQIPEAPLARELGMCYVNISVVTDYDVGLEGMPPVSHPAVMKRFAQTLGTLEQGLTSLIPAMDATPRDCACAEGAP